MIDRIKMSFRLAGFLWLWLTFYSLFGLAVGRSIERAIVGQPQRGPILFWQDGAIYTIDPDGTDLRRVTQALLADQRFTAVSPACQGLVQAPCWVLVGHVLYNLSGKGVPLPLLENQEWLDAPASWAPDGTHLAYPVLDRESATPSLVVYDLRRQAVWQVAEGIDDSVAPAWSPGCRHGLQHGCFLAFARRTSGGEGGLPVSILDLERDRSETWPVSSGLGAILRWTDDGQLYHGRFNWYHVKDGRPLADIFDELVVPVVGPGGRDVAYVHYRSGLAAPGEHCRRCDIAEIRLSRSAAEPVGGRTETVYAAPADGGWGFNHPVFWSPLGDRFAAFSRGRLLVYDLPTKQVSVWYESRGMDLLDSHAFSPTGDGIALVEGVYLRNPERPDYRLFVVHSSGEVSTLRPRSRQPIIVLAWLPAKPEPWSPRQKAGEFVRLMRVLVWNL